MITIRPAVSSDVPLIFEMVRASALDQGFPESLVVTEASLLEDGFGPNPLFHCAIAEQCGTPAGLALYFLNYSTWVSRSGLFLEDLYVAPEFRGAGVARALLEHLREIAKQKGCRRMQWVVHRDNAGAIRLYRSFGAQPLDDWMIMNFREKAPS